MTVLSRSARSRRGGRRPGWALLTALLVLAIAASSALVFTNRVELLKLAVILALWAAVVAAFVSVIYRRQSDADAAKARDLKLVYDLQLDREISARREYELTVESQLRRELASEARAQAADEVGALRAELAAMRNNLEILFGTELTHRPAIETERTTVRAYSDWARDTELTDPGRDSGSRFRQAVDVDTGENRIIDVPEEPLGRRPGEEEPLGRRPGEEEPLGRRPGEEEPLGRRPGEDEPLSRRPGDEEPLQPEPRGRRHAMDDGATVDDGVHYLPSDNGSWPPPRPEPEPEPVVAPRPYFRPSAPPAPPPPPQPEPEPLAERVGRHGAPAEPLMSAESEWNPAPAEGQWLPPGTPGSNWTSSTNGVSVGPAPTPGPSAASYGYPQPAPVASQPEPGRHASPAEGAVPPLTPPTPAPPPAEPPARHGVPVEASVNNSQHGEGQGQGQSVAELLARLHATPTGGGRRRRRED
jgi:hypothetical protein